VRLQVLFVLDSQLQTFSCLLNQLLLLIVGEGWNPRWVKVIEMAIENIEAEVAHLRPGYARPFHPTGGESLGKGILLSLS